MTLYKTNLLMKMEALLEKREKNHVMSKHMEEINDKQKCIAAKSVLVPKKYITNKLPIYLICFS